MATKAQMKEEIRSKWINALLSGKYKQGRYSLHPSEGRYCCLGVLCDLYRKETGNGNWVKETTEYLFTIVGDAQNLCLPRAVSRWAGIDPETEIELSVYNDGLTSGDAFSFREIAHFIENYAK